MNVRFVSLMVLLSACSGGSGRIDTDVVTHRPAEGRVQLCFGGLPQAGYGSVVYDVAGTVSMAGYVVASAFDIDTCSASALGVRFNDDAGQEWRLGMQIFDAEGFDVTPGLDLEDGDRVQLHYVQLQDFGSTSAFVLTDEAGGLVAAVEEGVWGTLLADGDLPGMTVAPGETVQEMDDECGHQAFHSILFAGDQPLSLDPYAAGEISVGGASVMAYALGAMSWEGEVSCTDLAGRFTWAVVR